MVIALNSTDVAFPLGFSDLQVPSGRYNFRNQMIFVILVPASVALATKVVAAFG
jgi:hypothetical protein